MVIDSNILIACLNAEAKAVTALSNWKEEGRALFISSVSFAEVLSVTPLTTGEIAIIKAFLKNFISIPFDDSIAELAGFLRREYRLEIPDAAIAATAFARGVPLVTRDKQFTRIKEILMMSI